MQSLDEVSISNILVNFINTTTERARENLTKLNKDLSEAATFTEDDIQSELNSPKFNENLDKGMEDIKIISELFASKLNGDSTDTIVGQQTGPVQSVQGLLGNNTIPSSIESTNADLPKGTFKQVDINELSFEKKKLPKFWIERRQFTYFIYLHLDMEKKINN